VCRWDLPECDCPALSHRGGCRTLNRTPDSTAREDLGPQRVWTLHKGEHAAAIDLNSVPGIGAELVLTMTKAAQDAAVRSHEQAGLVGATDPRTMSGGKGWA
jgi:hypothetical protein